MAQCQTQGKRLMIQFKQLQVCILKPFNTKLTFKTKSVSFYHFMPQSWTTNQS